MRFVSGCSAPLSETCGAGTSQRDGPYRAENLRFQLRRSGDCGDELARRPGSDSNFNAESCPASGQKSSPKVVEIQFQRNSMLACLSFWQAQWLGT